jgi:hypothetical protein
MGKFIIHKISARWLFNDLLSPSVKIDLCIFVPPRTEINFYRQRQIHSNFRIWNIMDKNALKISSNLSVLYVHAHHIICM